MACACKDRDPLCEPFFLASGAGPPLRMCIEDCETWEKSQIQRTTRIERRQVIEARAGILGEERCAERESDLPKRDIEVGCKGRVTS